MKFMEVPLKGQVFQIRVAECKNQIWFHFNGRIFVLDKHKSAEKPDLALFSQTANQTANQTKKTRGERFIVSPMPGQVVKLLAQPGMKVKENQTLVILSSMKMEYVLKSEIKGVIKSVKTKEGETVSSDQILVEISNNI